MYLFVLAFVFSCLWVQMCLLNSPHKKVMASGREGKPDMFCMYLFCFIFVFVFTGFCIFLSLGPDVFAKFPAQEGDGIWQREEARHILYVFVWFYICICLYWPLYFLCLGPDVFAKFPAQEGDGIWRREEARQVFLRKVLAQDVGSSTNQPPATVEN